MMINDTIEISEAMAKLSIGNHRAAKALDLYNIALHTAEAINKKATKVFKYKLPRIARAARSRRALGLGMMGVTAHMAAMQMRSIIVQPFPVYSEGVISSSIAPK